MVLRVAPGEAHHRRDDGQELSRLDGRELQRDLNVASVGYRHHPPHLVRDVDDVRKDDVALDDRLKGGLHIDLNKFSPRRCKIALPFANPRVHPLIACRRLVDPVPVELEESCDWLPEDYHKEGDQQPSKKAAETSQNLEALSETSVGDFLWSSLSEMEKGYSAGNETPSISQLTFGKFEEVRLP